MREDVDGGHLVLVTNGVLAIGAKGHVDLVLRRAWQSGRSSVRVTRVVDVPARGLDCVVDRLIIHGGDGAGQRLVRGNQDGPVEGIQWPESQYP